MPLTPKELEAVCLDAIKQPSLHERIFVAAHIASKLCDDNGSAPSGSGSPGAPPHGLSGPWPPCTSAASSTCDPSTMCALAALALEVCAADVAGPLCRALGARMRLPPPQGCASVELLASAAELLLHIRDDGARRCLLAGVASAVRTLPSVACGALFEKLADVAVVQPSTTVGLLGLFCAILGSPACGAEDGPTLQAATVAGVQASLVAALRSQGHRLVASVLISRAGPPGALGVCRALTLKLFSLAAATPGTTAAAFVPLLLGSDLVPAAISIFEDYGRSDNARSLVAGLLTALLRRAAADGSADPHPEILRWASELPPAQPGASSLSIFPLSPLSIAARSSARAQRSARTPVGRRC